MTNLSANINVQASSGKIQYLNTYAESFYAQKHQSVSRSFVSAVDTDILETYFTKVYSLFIKVNSGDLTLKLTNVLGTDQIITVDRVFYMESVTRPITNIKVSGTADIEIFILGE